MYNISGTTHHFIKKKKETRTVTENFTFFMGNILNISSKINQASQVT